MVTSAQAHRVVKTIADQAKEAADQCSGTRPALVILHLIDPIGTSELREMLYTANGMHAIAGAVSPAPSVNMSIPSLSQYRNGRALTVAADLGCRAMF